MLDGRGTATDWVTLGKSGVKVPRLAFGTGSQGGRVQRDLGQRQFTRLVRYAYDHGVCFFDTAEEYCRMHEMLGVALSGIPRDSYRLMSKVTTDSAANPRVQIDELRRLANTEYFDVMLMHCQQTATWPTDTIRWQEEILEAKSRRVVLGFGASVHGLPALRKLAESKWAEIAMIRTNHRGTMMDAEGVDPAMCGDVAEVVKCVGRVRSESIGVIGMKLVGEGAFTTRADRQAAMKFAFNDAHVDCVSIGFKSTMEIDEAIENLASAVITARV